MKKTDSSLLKEAYQEGKRFVIFIRIPKTEHEFSFAETEEDFPEHSAILLSRVYEKHPDAEVSDCYRIQASGELVNIEGGEGWTRTGETDMAEKELLFNPKLYHTEEGKPRFTMVCIDKRHLFTNSDDCDAMVKRLNALIEKKDWTLDDRKFLHENGFDWMVKLFK
jgi:hypothetical protein